MQKIPTLFVRDLQTKLVIDQTARCSLPAAPPGFAPPTPTPLAPLDAVRLAGIAADAERGHHVSAATALQLVAEVERLTNCVEWLSDTVRLHCDTTTTTQLIDDAAPFAPPHVHVDAVGTVRPVVIGADGSLSSPDGTPVVVRGLGPDEVLAALADAGATKTLAEVRAARGAMSEPEPTPALLPCPFCGHGEPEFERTGDRRRSCIVICGMCGCRHESSDEGRHNGSSWNRRAPAWTHDAAGCPIYSNGLKTAMLVPAGDDEDDDDDAWSLSAWECGHTLVEGDVYPSLGAAKRAAEGLCREEGSHD